MRIRSLQERGRGQTGKASYALTIPKRDLEADGYLPLLQELDQGLPAHITHTGDGTWTVELRPDLLPGRYDDLLVRLDLELVSDAGARDADGSPGNARPARVGPDQS